LRGAIVPARSTALTKLSEPFNALTSQKRSFRHRGVLKLICNECRYVIKRWHVPILSVDCNANPRHKQALTNTAPRARPIPEYLLPYLTGKQYPRHPAWRAEKTFVAYTRYKDNHFV